jgi:hypothetical protein
VFSISTAIPKNGKKEQRKQTLKFLHAAGVIPGFFYQRR